MNKRICEFNRETLETNISIKLNLDGMGNHKISTTIPFLDHMLSLFAKHGKFDLEINAKGDTNIDEHHLIEDMGISLGQTLKNSLGEKRGIKRYGFASIPMDDSLVNCSLDISNRPFLIYNMLVANLTIFEEKEKYGLYKHFFNSLSCNLGLTLHLNLFYGENLHHNLEAGFKAFGIALKEAVSIEDKYAEQIPSTKGIF